MTWKATLLTYGILLLLVGIQVGIIIFPGFEMLFEGFQVLIILGYWAIVVAVFVLLTNRQIKEAYDKPMRKLSEATKQVAEGDFSIYLEPVHTADSYDYIDIMFQDFNKMVEALGSLESMKGDFIANVSHEFKTPLAVIQSYASALLNPNLTQEQRLEHAATIMNSTEKLSSLVSNILKLNKIENQVIRLNNEPYDLCRQLGECIIAFEEKWSAKEIELEVEMDDRVTIHADSSMLEIVWHNLISNAIKFTDPGGTITIQQSSEEDAVVVSVSDTGCGMDQKTRERIFDKFYQGDTSHSTEGNGLGLALVSKIVSAVGGTLTLESELGQGSTFTVTLPVN